MFSAEAQQWHASFWWNCKTRQVSSIEEEELAEFLAEEDDLNLSDEPTQEKKANATEWPNKNDQVQFEIPEFIPPNFPSMNPDTDSVSTFHPSGTKATRKSVNRPAVDLTGNSDSVSKTSDTASNISTLKSSVSDLDILFKSSFLELRNQAQQQAAIQQEQGLVLKQLLSYFQITPQPVAEDSSFAKPHLSTQSEVANSPQTQQAGDSTGAAGHS